MFNINLYEILGIDIDCTNKEIKKAYGYLAKKYHPDKKLGNAQLFESINYAYTQLIDPIKRMDYDKLCKLSENIEHSHIDLKQQHKSFKKSAKQLYSETNKSDYENEFKKEFENLDKKHGLDLHTTHSINVDESFKLFDNLLQVRLQEQVSEKIFNDNISSGEFNNKWVEIINNKNKEREKEKEREKNNENNHELIINKIPVANNSLSTNISLCRTDNDYGQIYTNDNNFDSNLYGPIDFESTNPTTLILSQSHFDFSESLEEKLKKRELETNALKEYTLKDFDNSNFYFSDEGFAPFINKHQLLKDTKSTNKTELLTNVNQLKINPDSDD